MTDPRLEVVADAHRPRVHGGRIADLAGRLGFRARAWTKGGVVFIAESAFYGPRKTAVALVAHEFDHIVHPFEHHQHLCGKSVPVVGRRHLSADSIAWAESVVP